MKILKNNINNIITDVKNIAKSRTASTTNEIDSKVKNIINEVILKGDEALVDLAKKYENNDIIQSQIILSDQIRNSYKDRIDHNVIKSFNTAIKNITAFHDKQLPKNYEINNDGLITGTMWKPIDSVGLYVPGGISVYPSSLLMNVIPALVAGVNRIAITTPCKNGNFNPYLLALLDIFNIKEVYQIGGAQAIAALAYGTQTIKPVNKIFGPGNAYVASAKKQVFGSVGIDLIAGPSEIVVVADQYNNPQWVASDLIAQAEHDEKSQSILITDDENFAFKVQETIKLLLTKLNREEIIKKSLKNYGIIILLDNLEKAAEVINFIAPEHLHLQNKAAEAIFKKIKNAGCIFLGEYSPEVFGDYIVGTNHILPTMGTAKYSSGLGVIDFMKRTSYIRLNKKNFDDLSDNVVEMASVENLEGHKLSVTIRQTEKK